MHRRSVPFARRRFVCKKYFQCVKVVAAIFDHFRGADRRCVGAAVAEQLAQATGASALAPDDG
jgi:hypothetical protein